MTTDARSVTMLRWLLGCAVLLVVVGTASPAAAYRPHEHCGILRWEAGRNTLYVSTTSFPPSTVWSAAVTRAAGVWTGVNGSRWVFDMEQDTDGTHEFGNRRNEAYFASGLDEGLLGVTRTQPDCPYFFGDGTIVETDIAISLDYSWTLSRFDYAHSDGEPVYFEPVMMHEMGHSLGLAHDDRWLATMNTYYLGGGPVGAARFWTPLADDRQGVRYLYPDYTGERDIAAIAMKHGVSGAVPVWSPQSLWRGGSFTFEYGVSNMSKSENLTFDVAFYLSTDARISREDVLLGRVNGSFLEAGMTALFRQNIGVPASVAPGPYSLGYILDPDNRILERSETNNVQDMPRGVTIR